MTPNAEAKEIDKLELIKIKTFSVAKDIIKKARRQLTEWLLNGCRFYFEMVKIF